jgi:hypothetical protein
MPSPFTLRKFVSDDLQAVMQINRVCLPENYTDFFFVDLHQRFPETFIVAEEGEKSSATLCAASKSDYPTMASAA